jgi:hypothetical protein
MFRVVVLYEREPDAAAYREHVAYVLRVPGVAFSHGPIFGSPAGEPRYRYCAQLEWPDRASFDAGTRSPEMAAAGEHALSFGIPFEIVFVEATQES